ncbi:MAG: kaiC [Mycobacterium sp.]|nr:kaiC [Mycobacterium sp.]
MSAPTIFDSGIHPRIHPTRHSLPALPKAPSGIAGLDEVTGGGLPQGRATLVCGPAGCGKTLLGMEFLVRGITAYGEPGVFVAFEESTRDLEANVASLGFDLPQMQADGMLVLDHIELAPAVVDESGEWDLEALFIRLGSAIDQVKAKRIVLDTLENLFGAFSDAATVRSELRRLFGWLKERGLTAVVTGERGDGALTRFGIEEYVSDCVIVLDHRVTEQTSTRRLRVLKYRGSLHGTNEYPFFIGESGVSVLPITSLGLQHTVSEERISTGITRLDGMLGGSGVYRGSSILVSGTAGTGKSTIVAQICAASCARGERALYVAFEESAPQIIRNMASVGIELERYIDEGLIQFHCVRPSLVGLEAHLFTLQKLVTEFEPSVVVLDPISDLMGEARDAEVTAMLTREIDYLKGKGITAIFVGLSSGGGVRDSADQQIASLIDTWLLVKAVEGNGERNRALYILKSRGMPHSNQVREFLITSRGIELADVYVGPHHVLTGSARAAQEADERLKATTRRQDLEQRQINLERRRKSVEAQTAIIWREFEAEADVVERLLSQGSTAGEEVAEQRVEQGRLRNADLVEHPELRGVTGFSEFVEFPQLAELDALAAPEEIQATGVQE